MQKAHSGYSIKYIIGLSSIFIAILLFFNVFLTLSKSQKKDVYMSEWADPSFGWEYEALRDGRVTSTAPKLQDDGYTLVFPEGQIQAVKMSRTMTEAIPNAEMELQYFLSDPVEVFLDDLLLFSPFESGKRNPEGFLLLDEAERSKFLEAAGCYPYGATVRLSLPSDYTGKELTVFTYFLDESENCFPIYPYLGSEESRYVPYIADTVMPIASMVLCAAFVVLLLLVFVLDMLNGRTDLRIFLLILYFILIFIQTLFDSALSSSFSETALICVFFLSQFPPLPLCLYLALLLTGWRKWVSLGGLCVWSIYTAIRTSLLFESDFYFYADMSGIAVFLLSGLLAVMFLLEYHFVRKKESRPKNRILYLPLAAAVSAVCITYDASRVYVSIPERLQAVFSMLLTGYAVPLTCLLQNIVSAMAVIILLTEFLRRSEENQAMVTVLEERGRATLDSYNRMLDAAETTNSLRHEMFHHITALMGLIQDGKNQRAIDYITSIEKELGNLPVFRYSQNILVNIIAGSYLDRASKLGISVKHSLMVPKDLPIRDEDLSILLSNMLQNALEACERMETGAERHISVKMYVRENFLFIGCANSMSAEQEAPRQHIKKDGFHTHGYGLKAMEKIAEKYGGVLKLESTSSEFSLQTYLCLDRGEESH